MQGSSHTTLSVIGFGAVIVAAETIGAPVFGNTTPFISMLPILSLKTVVVASSFIACGLGALLPDIDEPNSKISHLMGFIGRWIISPIIRRLSGGHREGTHTIDLAGPVMLIPALILLLAQTSGGVAQWLAPYLPSQSFDIATRIIEIAARFSPFFLIALGFGFGYNAHLWEDAMTPHGVPSFFLRTQVHLLPAWFRIRTGSIWEHALVGLMLMISGALLWQSGLVWKWVGVFH